MRKPFVTEVVRVDFQFRNAQTGAGLEGISGVEFRYLPPGSETPVVSEATASPINPKTGATEPGWFFVDVTTTVEGTYRCVATCTTPSRAVAVGNFVAAPMPF